MRESMRESDCINGCKSGWTVSLVSLNHGLDATKCRTSTCFVDLGTDSSHYKFTCKSKSDKTNTSWKHVALPGKMYSESTSASAADCQVALL